MSGSMTEFTLFVPPGWMRFDLVDGSPARPHQVSTAVRQIVRGVPAQQRESLVRFLESQLLAQLEAFGDGGAFCVLMPVSPVVDFPVRPVVAVMPLRAPEGMSPMDVLVAVASADATSEVVEVEGCVALKRVSRESVERDLLGGNSAAEALAQIVPDAEFDGESQVTWQANHVRYLMGNPASDDQWLDVAMSFDVPLKLDMDDVVEAAEGLFHEMVQTIRWTDA